jgi:CubicO group peptidase (beta-lactamase class C family)
MKCLTQFAGFALLAATSGHAICSDYYPPPDTRGGWRSAQSAADARKLGIDRERLDAAFRYIQGTTKHGGLLVVRRGWLVYEEYFGRGNREATPNSASVGKSFTSIAAGILIDEKRDLFPDGLDQRVYTQRYLPPAAFPLDDPRKAKIRLGELLAMTAGIRGNNPALVKGAPLMLDPTGPDGWPAMTDRVAFQVPLWCEPGEGYSYATASVHIVSAMIRHVTGRELQDYIADRIAQPLGWGRWGFGYRRTEVDHTPGGGGIALRPTDMLRFAYLLLREGNWDGQQIVPRNYIRHCGGRSPYNPHSPYSLQFNVNADGDLARAPGDAFWKTGSGGHCIYIVPSLDMIILKLGGRDEQYSESNTGLKPQYDYDGSREGWRPTEPDANAAARRTLEMVLDAVIKSTMR